MIINCKAKFTYRINYDCKKAEKINAMKAESKLVILFSTLNGAKVEEENKKSNIAYTVFHSFQTRK